MSRKLIIYIVLLFIVVTGLVFIDASKPRTVDWTPTYSLKDKIPFGLYVFDHEAPSVFKDTIHRFSITPYEYLDAKYNYDDSIYSAKGTFINISAENRIDPESAKELLYFAEHGNTVFLSMSDLPYFLLDTLKVKTGHQRYKDSVAFTYRQVKKGVKRYFSEGIGSTYFSAIDTLTTTVLGHQETDTLKHANLIRVPFGKGNFILHTQPVAFTNFHLLKADHHKYTEDLLSYIPQGTIYWYTKSHNSESVSNSKLRYILSQPGLKWAFYISLISLLIFIIFNARRKQRVIPEISPLRNTTVDFTKTIGNLYYQEGNHHTIIEKKIIYFLEHIRNEYLIDTYSLDDEFVEKLYQKTGKPVEDIQKAVSLIKKYRHQFQSTEADVIEINKAIENLRL